MTQQRYGFMREEEADLVDKVIDRIGETGYMIRFLEIGVFGGGTVTGVVRRCRERRYDVYAAGVDFAQWKPNPIPLSGYEFHEGDSMDQWRNIKGTFNFLFIDGCHCVNHSMCDFLNYSPFVEVGGYCLFHDTALPGSATTQEAWPQDHSYAGKPPSTLGVREGLQKLGLLQGYRSDWKLIEEVPSGNGLMGMILFQKILEL